MRLHPIILKKHGRSDFVVLPYEEFVRIQERLEDAADLIALDRARKENAGRQNYTLEEVKLRLGFSGRLKSRRKKARH